MLLGPEGLILSHVFFITITSLLVFRIAKEFEFDDGSSLICTLIYLFNPVVVNSMFWDFMEVSIGVFLCALATLFLIRKQKLYFLLMIPLLLTVKEQFGAIIAGFGILWIAQNKDIKFGTFLIIFGLASCYLIIFQLMPYLRGTETHIMFAEGNMTSRYAWLGQGWEGVVDFTSGFFENPSLWMYVPTLLFLFLFIPLLGVWFLAPAGADMVINLLASVTLPRSFYSYHSLIIIFFFLISAMYVIKTKFVRKDLWFFALLVLNLAAGVTLSQLPFNENVSIWKQKEPINFYDSHIDEIKSIIGDNSKIAAYKHVGGYFADRLYIYPYPNIKSEEKIYNELEFIIINAHINAYGSFGNSFFYDDVLGADPNIEVEKLLQDKWFELVYDKNNWWVFKRKK